LALELVACWADGRVYSPYMNGTAAGVLIRVASQLVMVAWMSRPLSLRGGPKSASSY
jgi:hypothetical protein